MAAKTSNAIGVQNRKEKANNHSTKSEMGQILQCHQNSNPAMALEEKFADLRLWSRSGFASCCMIFESDKTFVTLSLQSQPCFRSLIIQSFIEEFLHQEVFKRCNVKINLRSSDYPARSRWVRYGGVEVM